MAGTSTTKKKTKAKSKRTSKKSEVPKAEIEVPTRFFALVDTSGVIDLKDKPLKIKQIEQFMEAENADEAKEELAVSLEI